MPGPIYLKNFNGIPYIYEFAGQNLPLVDSDDQDVTAQNVLGLKQLHVFLCICIFFFLFQDTSN